MFENAALSSSANRRFLCEGIIFRKNGGLWLIFCVAQGWKVSFISEKFNSTWKVQDIWVVNQNSIVRFASYFFLSWQRVEGWSRCGRISTASSVFAYPSWTMAPNDYASKLHDVTLSRQHWSNSAPSPAGILSLFWALCPKLYGLKLTAWRGGNKAPKDLHVLGADGKVSDFKWPELWGQGSSSKDANQSYAMPTSAMPVDKRRRRVLRFMRSKGVSDGLHASTPEVAQKLRDLHPDGPQPSILSPENLWTGPGALIMPNHD